MERISHGRSPLRASRRPSWKSGALRKLGQGKERFRTRAESSTYETLGATDDGRSRKADTSTAAIITSKRELTDDAEKNKFRHPHSWHGAAAPPTLPDMGDSADTR
ncbi:hypothetical protein GCM10009820_17910 [Leifsonia soli]